MGIIGKCQYRRHDWTAFVRKFDCGHAGMAHVKPGAVHRVGDIQHTAHESCAEPLMRKERDSLSIFAGCQISTPASIEHIALFCQKRMGIVPNSLIAAAETGIRQCGILPPLMTQCSHFVRNQYGAKLFVLKNPLGLAALALDSQFLIGIGFFAPVQFCNFQFQDLRSGSAVSLARFEVEE